MMSGSTRVKNQHYVPQSYLRRFASPREQVHVFDKYLDKSFISHVKNVASEEAFYDLPGNHGANHKVQAIEQAFSRVEGAFAGAVGKLLLQVDTGQPLTDQQKMDFAYFIIAQQARTRQSRNTQTELFEKAMGNLVDTQLKAASIDLDALDYSLTFDDKVSLAMQAQFVFDKKFNKQLIKTLLNHRWLIGMNATSEMLLTSDHPIVKRPHVKHPIQSMNGIGSLGIEIAFPISPTVILLLFDPQIHQDLVQFPFDYIVLDSTDVQYYNKMQIEQCQRQVFSISGEFHTVRQLCEEFPILRDPDRPMVEVIEHSVDEFNDIMQMKDISIVVNRSRPFQNIGKARRDWLG